MMLDQITGFHIEPTNICTLKCPACPRTRFQDEFPKYWKNQNLVIDHVMKFLDIDLTGKKINFCGNYGDPIYHPDFIELVKSVKQRGAVVAITTNGSYKKTNWWEQLVFELDSTDLIQFSIDGTPENFTQYRINADWESISDGIQVTTKSAVKTAWKYIPFSFNQDKIDQARELSQQLGIDQFVVDPSDRFDSVTEWLRPEKEKLIGFRYQSQIVWKNDDQKSNGVTPKCQLGHQHFITAEGFYSPCCFLADHRFYYKSIFGKQKKQYDITDQTLSQILQQDQTITFYQTLQSHPGCQFNCPKV